MCQKSPADGHTSAVSDHLRAVNTLLTSAVGLRAGTDARIHLRSLGFFYLARLDLLLDYWQSQIFLSAG